MMDHRLPPDRCRPAGQATRRSFTSTDLLDQHGPPVQKSNSAAVLETSFSAFLSTSIWNLNCLSSHVFAQLHAAADQLLVWVLASMLRTFSCLLLLVAGLTLVGLLLIGILRIPTLFVLCCRPSSNRVLTSGAQTREDARFPPFEVPAKTPLHVKHELDSSQRHFCILPDSPQRHLHRRMTTLPSSGDDSNTKRGCPYTSDAPGSSGRACTLHTRRMMLLPFSGDDSTTKRGCPYSSDAPLMSGSTITLSRSLDYLALRLTVNWEGCLIFALHWLFLAILMPLFLILILTTAFIHGDARSPLTLYQALVQNITYVSTTRCSFMGCCACTALLPL